MCNPRFALASVFLFTSFASCSSPKPPQLGVSYDDNANQILVTFGRGLEGDETLHARVRRGQPTDLDCAAQINNIARIDDAPAANRSNTWRGPHADDSMFEELYDNSWLEGEPTAEMLEQAAAGGFFIDVCLMANNSSVVRQQSFDIRRALDEAGADGKFDGDDEERIASTVAYAEACIAELGEIPFFEKLADGDYSTYNCLDSTPIPTTVTDASGNVTRPETEVDKCDNPQYIYSLCEPSAVDGRTNGPRVASRSNEQGTSWTLLCRKAKNSEGAYNDIAMIGTNPFSGKTCFFQNALYSRTDGQHVPHPGDKVESESSAQQSSTLWNGIHGGLGSGIECAGCHSTDALVHTPWIDGAVNASGDPVIPKMGSHDDFVLGYNDAPYSIINASGQGWSMPKHLVNPEADACTRCHRIGDGRWTKDWLDRLIGKDAAWTNITTDAYQSFEHVFWMPAGLDGVDASTWDESEFGKAVEFIQACGDNPSSCEFVKLPTDEISDGGLPVIELEGSLLAIEGGRILGARVASPDCPSGDCRTRRCAECHSVSKTGLRHWLDLTEIAWNDCGLNKPASEMSESEARSSINCLRTDPNDEGSVFEAAKLGILTTGVQYTDFRRVFQKAYGDNWSRHYAGFKARVGMPKGNHPKLSQKEFATLLKWFEGGLNDLDVLRDPPPPTTCNESWNDTAITSHLSNMQFDGWAAQNADSGIRMYGCAPGAAPLTCLSSKPDRSGQWGNSNGTIRELAKLSFRTSYWTRSSADGRYVGNGGGPSGSTITDLQTSRDIGVKASYDPGFFPDNSGFIFQGSVGGAGICSQSLLASDDLIDFSETQCMTAVNVNLYQHVARGTSGGDYFIINSQFTSDPGGASTDPRASFNADSTMKFTPMIFNGTSYEQKPQVIVESPFEGDSVLSPSAKMVASRLAGPGGKGLGYVIRRVIANPSGSSYSININQKLATVCMPGAKPSFSFDERFAVTHTYASDKSNLMLLDLKTHNRVTITDMPSGVYAQFPHFRSDGWIYFLVVDGDDRYIAASDAAVRLLAQ